MWTGTTENVRGCHWLTSFSNNDWKIWQFQHMPRKLKSIKKKKKILLINLALKQITQHWIKNMWPQEKLDHSGFHCSLKVQPETSQYWQDVVQNKQSGTSLHLIWCEMTRQPIRGSCQTANHPETAASQTDKTNHTWKEKFPVLLSVLSSRIVLSNLLPSHHVTVFPHTETFPGIQHPFPNVYSGNTKSLLFHNHHRNTALNTNSSKPLILSTFIHTCWKHRWEVFSSWVLELFH